MATSSYDGPMMKMDTVVNRGPLKMYRASRKASFTKPGLYVWAFKRNIRLIPFLRKASV